MKPLYGNVDDAQYIKELEARCCRAVEKIERLTAENSAMREALDDFVMLIAESNGVDGWHLNGDIAEWNELLNNETLSHYKDFVSGNPDTPEKGPATDG